MDGWNTRSVGKTDCIGQERLLHQLQNLAKFGGAHPLTFMLYGRNVRIARFFVSPQFRVPIGERWPKIAIKNIDGDLTKRKAPGFLRPTNIRSMLPQNFPGLAKHGIQERQCFAEQPLSILKLLCCDPCHQFDVELPGGSLIRVIYRERALDRALWQLRTR